VHDLSFGLYESETLVPADLTAGSYALELQNQCECLGTVFLGRAQHEFLGSFSLDGKGQKQGVFASIQTETKASAWTGIVLYNASGESASVKLVAYNDDGKQVGKARNLVIKNGESLKGVPESVLVQKLSGATHIIFTADREVFGLLINYHETSGNQMFEVLPSL
jgi:hypothetical protein